LNPTPGQSLTADATVSDADGDPVTLTYVWTDATTGTMLQTPANTSSLTDTLKPSSLSSAHVGDVVTVGATPYDGTAAGTPAIASTTVSDTVVARKATVSLSHRNSAGIDINLAATDGGGAPLTYSLVGTNGGALDGTVTLTGNVAHYTPTGTMIGTDAFQFTAGDGAVTSAPATVTVNLTNSSPVAASETYNVIENTAISVAGPGLLSSASDTDGDPLTAILVSPPSHGAVTVNADGSFLYVPQQDFTGIDVFAYRLDDGFALSVNVATVTLAVADIPPVANNQSYEVPLCTPLIVPAPGVLGNDSDVNGNPLIALLVSGPSHGTLTLKTDGSFVYSFNSNFLGVDTFSYAAYDGTALSNVATVVLEPAEPPPPPPPLFYTTPENVPLSVPAPGLLTNVDNPCHAPLSVVLLSAPSSGILSVSLDGSFVYTPPNGFTSSVSFSYAIKGGVYDSVWDPTTATVNVTEVPPTASDDTYRGAAGISLLVTAPGVLANDTDVSGLALTAAEKSRPAHGTLALNPDGSFAYIPADDFAGTDSFTYVATDGTSDSNVAAVTINVTETPPVAVDDGMYLVTENNSLTIAAPGVLANDTGTSGSPLMAQLAGKPVHGTVTLSTNGSFLYTPEEDFTGSDGFTYQASDGIDQSNVATVLLSIADTPAVLASRDETVVENTVLTVPAATGLLAGSKVFNHDPLLPVLAANPVHGRLTFQNDGSFVYTPDAGFAGMDSFRVLASDGTDLSNTATVSLTITPADIPVAQADSYTTPPGTTLTIAAPGVLANDSDPVNSPLTAALVGGPVNGTVTLKPDGSFSYAPDPGFAGSDSFTYEAINGTNPSAPVTVTLMVAPAPAPTPTPNPAIPVSGSYTPTPAALSSALTPPLVTGIANLGLSRRGLTAITLGFNEAINPASIVASGYGVLGAVKKQRKLVYSREVGTSGVRFDGDSQLTIMLARPYRGTVRVWLGGTLWAANGSSSSIDFVTTLGASGRALESW
jgi:hypothetical protein